MMLAALKGGDIQPALILTRSGATMRTVSSFLLLIACDQVPVDEQTVVDDSVYAETLTSTAVAAWVAGDLEIATDGPQTSRAVPGTEINVWVSMSSLDAYRGISSADEGSGAELDVGAMVVREILDEQGEITKLTVLVKGPLDANPDLGGWVFGVYGTDGSILFDDSGEPQVGALASCTGCHLARMEDDYLFGLP